MKKSGSWLSLYLIVGFIWGCSFIFIKGGLEILTPIGVAFIRCALGAITLYIFAKIKKIGKTTAVWTVDSGSDIELCRDLGVDIAITNTPARARTFL